MYNQTRSFNLGIALEVGIEAAIIYDDLAYAQHTFGEGEWFYRSYKQLINRLPFLNERSARRYIDKLEDAGWLQKKVAKLNGSPICHYRITKSLSDTVAGTIETDKMADSINIETIKETKDIKKTKTNLNNNISNSSVSFGGRATPPIPLTPPSDLLVKLIKIINPKEKPIASRHRTLKARLKEYSTEEIIEAAIVFSHSVWHKENHQMSIDNLLAPTKFGRWYAQRGKTSTEEANPDAGDDMTMEERKKRLQERMGKKNGAH